MSLTDPQGDRVTQWMRLAAKIIGVTWAGWWTYFFWGVGIAQGLPGLQLVLRALWPAALFFAVAALAWVSDLWGGIVMVATGVVLVVLVMLDMLGTEAMAAFSVVLLTTAQPPLTAGSLLLLAWNRTRNTGT